MLLCCFLNSCKGEVTGISFVDSTPIEVCHPCGSRSHKVFQDIAGWGKNSMGWHAASEACKPHAVARLVRFKLHLIVSDRGELLAFKLTPGNVDDRKPVPDMTKNTKIFNLIKFKFIFTLVSFDKKDNFNSV